MTTSLIKTLREYCLSSSVTTIFLLNGVRIVGRVLEVNDDSWFWIEFREKTSEGNYVTKKQLVNPASLATIIPPKSPEIGGNR